MILRAGHTLCLACITSVLSTDAVTPQCPFCKHWYPRTVTNYTFPKNFIVLVSADSFSYSPPLSPSLPLSLSLFLSLSIYIFSVQELACSMTTLSFCIMLQ